MVPFFGPPCIFSHVVDLSVALLSQINVGGAYISDRYNGSLAPIARYNVSAGLNGADTKPQFVTAAYY